MKKIEDLYSNLTSLDAYPKIFILRTGVSCNNKCIHCFNKHMRQDVQDLSIDLLKEVVDSQSPDTLIVVSGGEPTLRDDLIDLLQYIRETGHKSTIQTNARRFSDFEYTKKLACYIDFLQIPIHSDDENIFDSITQVPGSYKETLQAIENLKLFGVKFTTQTVINQLNYKHLPYDMIQSLVPGIEMMMTFACPDGDAYSKDVIPRMNDVLPYIQKAFSKYSKLIHTHYIPKCYLYPFEKDIFSIDNSDDGSTIKLGLDCIDKKWDITDFGAVKEGQRIKDEVCKDCDFNESCVGILNQYHELYNDVNLSEDLKPVKLRSLDTQLKILKNKLPQSDEDISYPNRALNVPELNKNPGFFILRTGFSCKSRCIHCFIENKRVVKDLTFDELKSTIHTIPKNSIITLSGGEPTDRNDLIDILKYIKESGYIINLESNGQKFADRDYLNSIAPYIDLAFVPVHSSDPSVFDITTGVRGSFYKTITGLKNLMSTDVYHLTISVFNKLNYRTMESTFDMIQNLFPGQLMSLTFPHPVGAAHTKDIVPRYSEVRDIIQRIIKKHGPHMYVHYIPKCFTYPYQDIVIDIGKFDRPGTDFINNSWQQVDYASKNGRVKASTCSECIYNDECLGIWREYSELYPDIENDLIPIKEKSLFNIDSLSLKFRNLDSNLVRNVLRKNPNIDEEIILSDPIKYSLRMKYSCDNSCIHCFAEDRKNISDLTFQEIKDEIDSISPEINAITLTGGEPTLHKDFKEIIQYAKQKNFFVDLQTNGNKLSDISYLKEIDPYLDSILLPIHSSNKEIFESITQVNGTFDKALNAFKNLLNFNIYVVTQTVINKLNYKTLVSTADMIQQIRPGTTMLFTFPCTNGAAYSIDVTPTYTEIYPYLQEVLKKYGYLIQTHHIPKCYLYPYQTLVRNIDDSDDGSQYKPGLDYTKNKWEQVDYGKLDLSNRIKSEECKDCRFNSECIGILKSYSELYNVDLKGIK